MQVCEQLNKFISNISVYKLLYFQFWFSVFINTVVSDETTTLWNIHAKNKKKQDAVAINRRQVK
jgi:hypothetical protein